MVVFVTSIRHPHNSNDFSKVERLFELSLRSVCGQDDDDFRVVVVCNVVPRIQFEDPRVIFHLVDFLPPSRTQSASIPLAAMELDKGAKLLSGMLLGREYDPHTYMIFDADDLVSRRLAGFLNRNRYAGGWYVDGGYLLNLRSSRFQRKSGLNRYCGTTLAPSSDALWRAIASHSSAPTQPGNLNADVSLATSEFAQKFLGDHKTMRPYFREVGTPMRRIPFRAAVWVQDTGENWTNRSWSEDGLPLTPAFCREFTFAMDVAHLPSASLRERMRETVSSIVSRVGSMYDVQ